MIWHKIVDTSDEWIFSRSGIRQRHYSHVSTGEMAWLAAERALASAGVDAEDIDLVLLGSTTPEEICPNTASYIKNKLGAKKPLHLISTRPAQVGSTVSMWQRI